MKTTENLLELIGCHHRYQIITSIIYAFIGILIDSSIFNLSLMVSMPFVDHMKEGESVTEPLTYTICLEKYDINYEKSRQNWLLEFDGILCDKTKVSLFQTLFYCGCVLGVFILQFFKDVSKELIIKCIAFIFSLSTLFLFIKSYWIMLVFNFVQGLCQAPFFLVRCSTITEITCNQYRSYFLITQILSSLLPPSYILLMNTTGLSWRGIYYATSILIIAANLINLFVVVTNPRFLMVNDNVDSATENAEYIRSFNKIGHHTDVANLNEILDPNTSQIIVPESVSLHTISHYEEKPKTFFIFNLFMLLVCGIINFTLILVEQKSYVNDPNYKITTLIGSYLCIAFFIFIGWLMNTSTFGRRYTLIMLNSTIIFGRLLYILFQIKSIYVYLLISIAGISTQIPEHALIMESFSNKGRLKYYSQIYLIAKIFSIFCPTIYEYTPFFFNQLISALLSLIVVLYLVFVIQETNKKHLRDF